MKKTLALALLIGLVSFTTVSSSFAAGPAFKACGKIERRGNSLTFVTYNNGLRSTSSIYAKNNDPTISKRLAEFEGFREVCVAARGDENDLVVYKILSYQE